MDTAAAPAVVRHAPIRQEWLALQREGGAWRVTAEHAFSPFEPGTRVRGIFTGPDGDVYVTSDRRLDADGRPDDLLVRIILPRS